MTDDARTDHTKQEVRERIWALLEERGAVPEVGVWGHIPNFLGADAAAERLAAVPAWCDSYVIKANPDRAQLSVRTRALTQQKTVYMAVPNLADERPFYLLDPTDLPLPPGQAATSQVAAGVARKVGIDDMPPIDLVVCGSVAVNRTGARVGKGAGYSDIEVALLVEAGLVGPSTTIVTTVHPLQVVDGPLPETEHDFRVDVIVTPDEIITCRPQRRPRGLMWDHLTAGKIASIPALAARVPGGQGGT